MRFKRKLLFILNSSLWSVSGDCSFGYRFSNCTVTFTRVSRLQCSINCSDQKNIYVEAAEDYIFYLFQLGSC